MGRIYTRVHRLLRLISAIQADRSLSASDLARLCEVHQRTIFRDIDTLNASGVPCAFDREANGYRIASEFFMPPVELTLPEAMAVVALLEDAGDGSQIPFMGAAARAAEKLRSQFPLEILKEVEPVDRHLHIDLARSAADDSARDVYEQVRRAIACRHVLRCRYDAVNHSASDGEAGRDDEADEEFFFRPYALWFCQRAWYVVGYHESRKAIRRLKLNRFTAMITTDRAFTIPNDFDMHADLGNAWRMIRGDKRYRVAVRFEREFADTASETRWHPTQQEKWDKSGRVTLRFSVDGLDEIVWWVLGYGPGARVLEPPELIERIKTLAQATAERYK